MVRWARRVAGALCALGLLLTGCSTDTGQVRVTIQGQTTTLSPIMICTDGAPKLYGDANGVTPVEVSSGERVRFAVSDDIKDKGWSIQVWSAAMRDGKLVPTTAIQVLTVGNKSTYDKLTTSDAAPEQIYLFVATPPEKGCQDAGGLWPIALVRTS